MGNSGGNEVKWKLSTSGGKYFNLNDEGELSFKKQEDTGKYGPTISKDHTQQFLVYSAEAGGRKTNSQIRLRVYVKIQNINDPLKPPTFPKTEFEVLENRASVGNLEADSPEGHPLKYHLVQDKYKRFALSEDGELRFQERKEPDYEKTDEHSNSGEG